MVCEANHVIGLHARVANVRELSALQAEELGLFLKLPVVIFAEMRLFLVLLEVSDEKLATVPRLRRAEPFRCEATQARGTDWE